VPDEYAFTEARRRNLRPWRVQWPGARGAVVAALAL